MSRPNGLSILFIFSKNQLLALLIFAMASFVSFAFISASIFKIITKKAIFKIKRCLLLGRKIMTNLDSILKSRDITLPTKVHLVKAIVFPVVMYGCESWTVK